MFFFPFENMCQKLKINKYDSLIGCLISIDVNLDDHTLTFYQCDWSLRTKVKLKIYEEPRPKITHLIKQSDTVIVMLVSPHWFNGCKLSFTGDRQH